MKQHQHSKFEFLVLLLFTVFFLSCLGCDGDTSAGGCNENPECGECPQWSPPAPGWCNDGTIVAGDIDKCGCQRPPVCVHDDTGDICSQCPQWAPPAPGWCNNGTIVAGQVDECGCQGPPTCDRSNSDLR